MLGKEEKENPKHWCWKLSTYHITAYNPYSGVPEHPIFLKKYFSSLSSWYNNVHIHSPRPNLNQVCSPELADVTRTQWLIKHSFFKQLCSVHKHKTWSWPKVTNSKAFKSADVQILVDWVWAASPCRMECMKLLHSQTTPQIQIFAEVNSLCCVKVKYI